MSSDLRRSRRLDVAAGAIAAVGAMVIGAAYWVGAQDTASPVPTPEPAPRTASAVRLVAFDSCEKALADFKTAGMAKVTPYGFITNTVYLESRADAPAEAGAGREQSVAKDSGHSTTNNHESAADEPDLVKTDGRRIVSVVDGTLRVVDTTTRQVTATLAIPSGHAGSLLLDGDIVLVTSTENDVIYHDRGHPGSVGKTTLTMVDLKGGARVASSIDIEGGYIDGRQVGSVARVVTRSEPRLPFVAPTDKISEAEALQRNKDVIQRSTIDDWIPHYVRSDGAKGRLFDCSSLSRPANYTGLAMLSVLTFDLRAALGTGDGVGVVADGRTVYGTAENLYVADDRVVDPMPAANAKPRPGGPSVDQTTSVHQFSITGAGRPTYLASGLVKGRLLNQYSLSEHRGNLRIATTKDDPGCCDQRQQSESSLAVLTRRDAELVEVGRVDGLGKTEQIYSVRFIKDTAYVVTFRRTDPLYTIDLSNPAAPKVTGELKITGFSAYLHPVGDGRLLGVGQEATEQGRVQGTQVSLFDTTAAQARVIAQHHVKGASSEVEFDPHAFLYWAEKGLVVLPLLHYDGGRNQPGVLVLRVDGDRLTEVATVSHPAAEQRWDTQIRRSLVAGGALWTVSGAGMLASDLTGLSQLAWVPFS